MIDLVGALLRAACGFARIGRRRKRGESNGKRRGVQGRIGAGHRRILCAQPFSWIRRSLLRIAIRGRDSHASSPKPGSDVCRPRFTFMRQPVYGFRRFQHDRLQIHDRASAACSVGLIESVHRPAWAIVIGSQLEINTNFSQPPVLSTLPESFCSGSFIDTVDRLRGRTALMATFVCSVKLTSNVLPALAASQANVSSHVELAGLGDL